MPLHDTHGCNIVHDRAHLIVEFVQKHVCCFIYQSINFISKIRVKKEPYIPVLIQKYTYTFFLKNVTNLKSLHMLCSSKAAHKLLCHFFQVIIKIFVLMVFCELLRAHQEIQSIISDLLTKVNDSADRTFSWRLCPYKNLEFIIQVYSGFINRSEIPYQNLIFAHKSHVPSRVKFLMQWIVHPDYPILLFLFPIQFIILFRTIIIIIHFWGLHFNHIPELFPSQTEEYVIMSTRSGCKQ